jgi:hypothetical protein
MKSRRTVLLLASAIAITAGTAFAQSSPAAQYQGPEAGLAHARYLTVQYYTHRPDWYRRWQLRRLYREPRGYTPDYRLCSPGACQDNPYY